MSRFHVITFCVGLMAATLPAVAEIHWAEGQGLVLDERGHDQVPIG